MTHVPILLVLMSAALLAAASANAAQSMSARALVEEAVRHEHAEGRERDYAEAAFGHLGLTWLSTSAGDDAVFLVTAEQLQSQ